MNEKLVTLEDLLIRMLAVTGRDAKMSENFRYGATRLARALGYQSTARCPLADIPRDRATRDRLLDAEAAGLSESSRRVVRSRVSALFEAAVRHTLMADFDFLTRGGQPPVSEVDERSIRDHSGRTIFGGRYRSFVDCLESAIAAGVPIQRMDLAGADLTCVCLDGLDLLGVRLVGARLDGATFTGSNLTRADLSLATGLGVRFCDAEMAEADLSNASLDGSSFEGSRMVHATLTSGSFRECNFDRADLRRVVARVAAFDNASFIGARLEQADLRAASLTCANFTRVRGPRLVIASASARGLVATGAELAWLDATGADLVGARLKKAKLTDAIFVAAKISSSSVDPRTARGADFSSSRPLPIRRCELEAAVSEGAPASRVA